MPSVSDSVREALLGAYTETEEGRAKLAKVFSEGILRMVENSLARVVGSPIPHSGASALTVQDACLMAEEFLRIYSDLEQFIEPLVSIRGYLRDLYGYLRYEPYTSGSRVSRYHRSPVI